MKSQLAEGWGQFLSQFSWDWFATLTFRDEVKSFTAHRRFERFVRDVERAAGLPIYWFRVDEIGSRLGRFHLHALFGNVGHLRRMYWMDKWSERVGYARIFPFTDRRGAAYYCAKYVTKQDGDWELSSNITAFQQYQPVLALHGPTKQPSDGLPACVPLGRMTSQRSDFNGQRSFPGVVSHGDTHPRSMISEVYKLEVTRGRGRFKEFF
jgi:hypothetical protein